MSLSLIRMEYGQFPQYSPPVGMTPDLGYHPAAHVFPAAALHIHAAAEQKRNDLFNAMKQQQLQKETSGGSPRNADEADKHEKPEYTKESDPPKMTVIEGLRVSGIIKIFILVFY